MVTSVVPLYLPRNSWKTVPENHSMKIYLGIDSLPVFLVRVRVRGRVIHGK